MPVTTVITSRCCGMFSLQVSSLSSVAGSSLSPRVSSMVVPNVWLDAGRSSSMRSPHRLRMMLLASFVDPPHRSERSSCRIPSIFCIVSTTICCSVWSRSLALSIACLVPVSGLSLKGRSPKVMVWSEDVSVSATMFRLIVLFVRSASLTARFSSSLVWEGSLWPRYMKKRGASMAFTPRADMRGLTQWVPFFDITRRLYSTLTAESGTVGFFLSHSSLRDWNIMSSIFVSSFPLSRNPRIPVMKAKSLTWLLSWCVGTRMSLSVSGGSMIMSKDQF